MHSMHDKQQLHAGRTVVVAGGTGNVGRVLTTAFLRAGATVVVPSRSAAKIMELRAEIGQADSERLITIEASIGDETDAPRLVEQIVSEAGPIDAAVATLGRFVPTPSLMDASVVELQQVVDGYLIGHLVAAKTLIPALRPKGSYTLINGPLAFEPMFPNASLVSTVTASQAMLARVLFEQAEPVRVNELVLYTPFGWGDEKRRGAVSQEEVARYTSYLASDHAAEIRGRTIHLDSLAPLEELEDRVRSSGEPAAGMIAGVNGRTV